MLKMPATRSVEPLPCPYAIYVPWFSIDRSLAIYNNFLQTSYPFALENQNDSRIACDCQENKANSG